MAHGIPCANCSYQEAEHDDDLAESPHPKLDVCPGYEPNPKDCKEAAKHPETPEMARWLEEQGYKTNYDLDEISMAERRRSFLYR